MSKTNLIVILFYLAFAISCHMRLTYMFYDFSLLQLSRSQLYSVHNGTIVWCPSDTYPVSIWHNCDVFSNISSANSLQKLSGITLFPTKLVMVLGWVGKYPKGYCCFVLDK